MPIEIRKDRKHFIVEDKLSEEFYEMNHVCIDGIQMMDQNMDLAEIECILKGKYPNEDIDVFDFAIQLKELNLIQEIDGVKIDINYKNKLESGLNGVSPRLGKLFFNRFTSIFYLGLFIINIIFFIVKPNLFPRYKDLFVFHLMVLNIPILMIITFMLVLFHEFGHIFAVRGYDLPTRLGIGHRLFLIVFETDMSSVWKLPIKDRNILYLAGLCFDNVILFIALAAQLLFSNMDGALLGIFKIIVLDIFIRMIYQCCIYMKTDLYFVLENSTGCYNLMESAQAYLKKFIPFMKSNEVIFEEEKGIVFAYVVFYLIGVLLTLILYLFFYIPPLLFSLKTVFPGLQKGPSSLPFWDAILFLLQLFIFSILYLYSWRKKFSEAKM